MRRPTRTVDAAGEGAVGVIGGFPDVPFVARAPLRVVVEAFFVPVAVLVVDQVRLRIGPELFVLLEIRHRVAGVEVGH